MATLIEAVNAFRPRIVLKDSVGMDVIAENLARGSLFSESIARMVLTDLQFEIQKQLRRGNAVRLPGIGRFRLNVRLDGDLRPTVAVASNLRAAVRDRKTFNGNIDRRENIGLSVAEIVAMWDEANPDNPVELGPGVDLAA